MRQTARGSLRASVMCIVSALVGSGAWAVPPTLKVGQLYGKPSVLFNANAPNLISVPAYRNESLPSSTPLPELLAQLPDIINALVGFHDSDIATLVDNDLIEPLDPFFERMGLDPKSFLTPNLYAAVSYKGKLWALPHLAHTYLISYDRQLFKRPGVEPSFETWEGLFQALQHISESPVARTGDEASLYFGDFPDEALFPMFLWLSGNTAPHWSATPPSGLELYQRFSGTKVFGLDADYLNSMTRLETYSSIPSTKGRGFIPLPPRLHSKQPAEDNLGSLSFLACFAIRKNSEAKLEAAQGFLKWLLTIETQLRLVEASRIDYAPYRRSLGSIHVPLYRPVLESEDFKALVQKVPDYQLLLDFAANATFATPIPSSSPMRQFVIDRQAAAMAKAGASDGLGGVLAAMALLLEPKSEMENAAIAAKPGPASVEQGTFDEF